MKKIIFFIFIFFTSFLIAQQQKKIRKATLIQQSQEFYLNGATRGSFGGKSRAILEIKLPLNTIEWYYSFSTTPNQGQKQDTKLLSELTNLLSKSNVYALAASAIFTPTGNGGACDIYLLDRTNMDAFYNKEGLLGNDFRYYPQGSRENYKNGVVKISDIIQGTFYLGFRNSSLTTGTNITVEVVAIVEENVLEDLWTENEKSTFKNSFFNTLRSNLDSNLATEISTCMQEKLTNKYTPTQFKNLNTSVKESIFENIYNECSSEYSKIKTASEEKGMTYGNLGWENYENGNVDKAIEFSEKALTFDNTLGFVKANLGLFYMIKGDDSKSIDFYVEAISDIKKDRLNTKRSLIAALDDIEKALIKYPNLNGFNSIKNMFKNELKKLD